MVTFSEYKQEHTSHKNGNVFVGKYWKVLKLTFCGPYKKMILFDNKSEISSANEVRQNKSSLFDKQNLPLKFETSVFVNS